MTVKISNIIWIIDVFMLSFTVRLNNFEGVFTKATISLKCPSDWLKQKSFPLHEPPSIMSNYFLTCSSLHQQSLFPMHLLLTLISNCFQCTTPTKTDFYGNYYPLVYLLSKLTFTYSIKNHSPFVCPCLKPSLWLSYHMHLKPKFKGKIKWKLRDH